jgi:hypothetical protein
VDDLGESAKQKAEGAFDVHDAQRHVAPVENQNIQADCGGLGDHKDSSSVRRD